MSTWWRKTPPDGGRHVSLSTIKRRLPDLNCREFTTRCKTPVKPQKQKKPGCSSQNRKRNWTDETKINLCQNDGKRKLWREKDQLMTQSRHLICQTWGWFCYGSGRYGPNGAGTLAFIDDFIVDGSNRMNAEVNGGTLCDQIQPNALRTHWMIFHHSAGQWS